MQSFRRQGLALATGFIAIGATAGVAQASTNPVTKAIDAQAKILKSASALQDLNHVHITTAAQAAKYGAKLGTLATALDKAATAVSHASTPTSSLKTGRNDWVSGIREVASGCRQFDRAFKDDFGKSTLKPALKKAEKSFGAGQKLVVKGDKLLGIKTSSSNVTS